MKDREHRRIKYENAAKENSSIDPKTRFLLESNPTTMAKSRTMNLEEPNTKPSKRKLINPTMVKQDSYSKAIQLPRRKGGSLDLSLELIKYENPAKELINPTMAKQDSYTINPPTPIATCLEKPLKRKEESINPPTPIATCL